MNENVQNNSGAGVLLYNVDATGAMWVLLGRLDSGWTSFGGGCMPGESARDAAARECHEETRGLIAREDIGRLLVNAPSIRTTTPSGRMFTLFLVLWGREHGGGGIVREFGDVETCGMEESFLEVREIGWHRLNELRSLRLRGPFRRDLARVERRLQRERKVRHV